MKVASFEKLKSDWNQSWFIDIYGNLHIEGLEAELTVSNLAENEIMY